MTTVSTLLPRVNVAYTPEKPKKRKPETGYKLHRKCSADKRTLLSTHQVLEARWLHEFGCWTAKRIATYLGVTDNYVRQLLAYVVRSKVGSPKADDFPAGYSPAMPRTESELLLEYLFGVDIDHIALTGGQGCIDVANNPGGLLAALREASGLLQPLPST